MRLNHTNMNQSVEENNAQSGNNNPEESVDVGIGSENIPQENPTQEENKNVPSKSQTTEVEAEEPPVKKVKLEGHSTEEANLNAVEVEPPENDEEPSSRKTAIEDHSTFAAEKTEVLELESGPVEGENAENVRKPPEAITELQTVEILSTVQSSAPANNQIQNEETEVSTAGQSDTIVDNIGAADASISANNDNIPDKNVIIEESPQKPAIYPEYAENLCKKNLPLLNAILHVCPAVTGDWDRDFSTSFKLKSLDDHPEEYERIRKLFRSSGHRFYVTNVRRIENPILWAQYLLKKETMRLGEKQLYHGSSEPNIMEICADNFNWRLHGDSRGNRFGKGVSFSAHSAYATNYCKDDHTMISAKVLIRNASKIHDNRRGVPPILPPTGFDTTTNVKETVYVKYEDADFYPHYMLDFWKIGQPRQTIQMGSDEDDVEYYYEDDLYVSDYDEFQ